MKPEMPQFRRCCFCLPLRYGLLAWGYFKMIADALVIALLSNALIFALIMTLPNAKENDISRMYTELIISIIAITVFFTDLIVTIVFIVGGHKEKESVASDHGLDKSMKLSESINQKNVQLIRVFYFLSMGMWVLTLLLAATSAVVSIQNLTSFGMRYWIIYDAVITFSFFFVVLVVQTYFLLLLRSEIIKLRNIGEFRFVNNAAEAECTMKCEEIVLGAETQKEGV